MALCVNQSGTWRNITTLCVNQSGTWRNINLGCINQSGTWRKFGGAGAAPTSVGCSFGGGRAICLSKTGSSISSFGVVWIVAPSSTEVSRTWYCRNDAVTTAEASAACGDWFIPSFGQLQNPGYACRTYWDSYSFPYWSDSNYSGHKAWYVNHGNFGGYGAAMKTVSLNVRAFRCVTY